MAPSRWIMTTLSTLVVVTSTIGAFNAWVDIYGLFRSAQGRRLPVLGDPRVAKYLLSQRYVPENFDAILVGASISANWDVTEIRKLRVYNESLNGGNIVEERSLVEAAINRPGIAVAFLNVHPALTRSHEFQTVVMSPSLRTSAIGSMSLKQAYKDWINIKLGRLPQIFNYAGTETFLNVRTEMNIHMKQMWNAPDFIVDQQALDAYLGLVASLRRHGVRIIFIVPPTSQDLLKTKRPQMDRYVQMMRSKLGDGDLWIDFLSTDLCENRANFSDGVHLTPAGASQVISRINLDVDRWTAEGRLRTHRPERSAILEGN